MLSQTVGANVRKYRLRRGLSQEHLAFAANLCVTTIGKIERGIANPTIDVLESIAKALRVPASWLFE